ncbi:MAG: short-chain fatty acyl-CoA regulator family protein [Pseudomonadota bacterium]
MARTLVGTRIREGRKLKGLTQSALAGQVGISAPYLNLIEHNKRGIAGKTLNAISEALDLPVRELTEGADQTLLDRLQEAAQADPAVKTEIDRLEEFVGRFPGWARLLKRLQDRIDNHDDELAALSDQLNRDPFFSEAMHLMLSNITALRSTAEILADEDDLPVELSKRFMANLRAEAVRLSTTAQEIQVHFDAQSQVDPTASDKTPSETFWETHRFFDATLETTPEALPQTSDPRLIKDFQEYRAMADALPLAQFEALYANHGFDPVRIASETGLPVQVVFRRMAHLPETAHFPDAGLLITDQAGGVLFRKPLPSLALPRRSGGCPLWPLYRAAQRPTQVIRARIAMPTGEELLTYSFAYLANSIGFDLPPTLRTAMLFAPFSNSLIDTPRDSIPLIEAGAQCSICPRHSCQSRRDQFILK